MAEYKTHLKDRWYVFLIGMNDITLEYRTHCEVSISEASISYINEFTERNNITRPDKIKHTKVIQNHY